METNTITLDEKAQKEELTILSILEQLSSQGEKRQFCEDHNLPWEEFLRLQRKWKVVLARYREEKENSNE